MTFNQIEKEFDLQLPETKFASALRGLLYQKELREEIKSFLKQSFIRYLQKELEQVKENLEAINDIENDFARGMRHEMLCRISILQAQIKELEGV